VEYAVELFLGRPSAAALDDLAERARLAAAELARSGTAVRYVRSILVPADETCFVLYEAESADAVARATRLAELTFERIVEALTVEAPLA
jgi:hypothetical protein